MKIKAKKVLSLVLALSLILTGVSVPNKVVSAEVTTENTEEMEKETYEEIDAQGNTVWHFYETDWINFKYQKGKTEKTVRSIFHPCNSDTKPDLPLLSSDKAKNFTFHSIKDDFIIKASISGNSITLNEFSYAGAKRSNVKFRVPDKIVLHGVESIEEHEEKDKGLVAITVHETLMEGYVTSIGTAFNGKYKDDTTCTDYDIIIPPRVTSLDNDAFKGNIKLTGLAFEGAIQEIGTSVFEGCNLLSSLNLTSLFSKVANNTIPDRCFYMCSSLENIQIPDSVLNIGKEAFYQCDQIDYLLLSDRIKTIGDNAFAMCSNLRYLYIESKFNGGDWSKVVDESERGKLVTSGVAIKPVVSKKGNNTNLKGYIYSPCDIGIFSRLDMKPESIKVTRDGNSVEVFPYDDTSYGYKTKAYYFNIANNDKGEYKVEGEDIKGNRIVDEFKYLSDTEDKTPPEVSISDSLNSANTSNSHFREALITFSDKDTYVSSATLDGKPIETKYICNEEGEHTLIVKDVFDNMARRVFYIDAEAPKISNINNNKVYTEGVNIKFTDNIGIKDIKINGESIESNVDFDTEFDYSLTLKGNYTISVEDFADNSLTYKIVIESDAPSAVITATGEKLRNGQAFNKPVNLTFSSISGIARVKCKVTDINKLVKEDVYDDGDPTSAGDLNIAFTSDGKYELEVISESGLVSKVDFIIDKTVPVINGIQNGTIINKEEASITISDLSLNKILLNGKEVSADSKVRYSSEGNYNLVAIDAAGNQASVSFMIDKTEPEIDDSIEDDKVYTKKTKVYFSDSGSGVLVATLNGKTINSGYKISKTGNYKLVVTDRGGLVSTKKFTVDISKPTVKLTGKKATKKKNSAIYKKSVKVVIKDVGTGIDSISLDDETIERKKFTCKKKGKHKLVITDKAGNKTTKTFRIK